MDRNQEKTTGRWTGRVYARAVHSVAALAHAIERWRRARRIEEELNQLDDRSLADIGIFRADIGRIAREAVNQNNDERARKAA